MPTTIARETVEALWRALEKLAIASRPHQAAEIGPAAAAAGWIAPLEIEGVLRAQEPRLAEMRMQSILDAFQVQRHLVYPHPKGRSSVVSGVERIAAADAAHLLIQLERLGLSVDPEPFCTPLAPTLDAQPYLTSAELGALWHSRQRHRMEPLVISTGQDLPRREPDDLASTAAGYRIAMFCDADGRPTALRATPPGRRRLLQAA